MRILLSTILLLSVAASGKAQTAIILPQPLAQVRVYLDLSDTQVQSILQNNNTYNQFSQEKQARLRQVQVDIAAQTAASPLDPMALGQSYAEVETICRQLRERATEVQKNNATLLTDAQRAKLQTLQDALKLLPVISEARSGGLMVSSTSAPSVLVGTALGVYSSTLASSLLGPPSIAACAAPSVPSTIIPVIRTGDFSPVP